MDKLFLTIINMSLTGAFVIASICFVRLLLKNAPKIVSYCLWAVVGFRLVFPFSIESVFSLIPFKAQTIPPDIAMQQVPHIDSGIPFVNNAVSSILPAATPTASVNPLQIWTTIGTFVWFVGVAVMFVYGIVSFVILKRKMRTATHIEANIYEAENIKSPFVLGVLKPKIYLPVGLSGQERNYILLHEQTHIRRHDHIVKFAAYFILCLHWFNPLAWVAFLLMGVDMELSCDERVLKEKGGEIKKNYSLSLLSLATERRFIGGSPLAFGEGGVKERIKNVLNFKKPSRVIIIVSVVLVVALSIGFAVNRATNKSILDLIMPMSMNNVDKEPHFAGTVTELYDNAILVSVNEGEDERRSSDMINVSLNVKLKDSMTNFTVGDRVIVYYNGEIAESYPAQVNTVYAIVLTNQNDSNETMDADSSSFSYESQSITLEDVRTLAKKGDGLLFEDFQKYEGANVSSNFDNYIMVYGVEGGYRLIVSSNQSGKPNSVNLESIWANSGSGIDIRYGDIDEFLSKWPIIMQVKDGIATPSGATITLKNFTGIEYTYGESYTVQRKTDNGWIDVVPILENYGFTAIGYILPPMESEEIIIDWEWLYGTLPAGDYRIAKEALFVKSQGDYDTFALYATFSIVK